MEPYKQYPPNSGFPILADVILKVKQWQDLTPDEELIYLIHIEELSPDEAWRIIKNRQQSSETENGYSFIPNKP